ncbi:Hypp3079 [Branchiostoma lanceolatum]|uniref:Hypp3079 protein n=1 Tax=Branchiostoma lanceolatum TaxID=7740 RepID=A0A8K0EQH7_BRALA|nr:Hypp3079 [Branchiostoma lanceolatum]
MFNKLERLLLLLLLVLKDGGTATPCDNCLSSCYCPNKDLRRVPQDLPTTAARLDLMDNDIGETLVLMCDVSGIPAPDVTVTLPSGLNATVESAMPEQLQQHLIATMAQRGRGDFQTPTMKQHLV